MDLVERIKDEFANNPSNLEEIRRLLETRKLSEIELAEIGISFVGWGFGEYFDILNAKVPELTLENNHSNHLIDAVSLLLEFGLNPNTIIEYENIMWSAMYVDLPGIGASVMKLLLENGGNPNLYMPDERETLFDYIAFKVSEDEYTHDYLHTVQIFWVLLAYGGRYEYSGVVPITMLGNNTVEIFKDFRLFDYYIEYPEKGNYNRWTMHIYNVETEEEVATF